MENRHGIEPENHPGSL